MLRYLILSSMLLILAACATGPKFPESEVNREVRPDVIAATPESAKGTKILWGGVIASNKNLADATQLEIIAYPLASSNQSPQTGKASEGRFLIVSPGYLESVDYAVGRRITVTGILQDSVSGRIGETPYQYPVVVPDDVYLWPRDSGSGNIPIRFGIGFIFSN